MASIWDGVRIRSKLSGVGNPNSRIRLARKTATKEHAFSKAEREIIADEKFRKWLEEYRQIVAGRI